MEDISHWLDHVVCLGRIDEKKGEPYFISEQEIPVPAQSSEELDNGEAEGATAEGRQAWHQRNNKTLNLLCVYELVAVEFREENGSDSA